MPGCSRALALAALLGWGRGAAGLRWSAADPGPPPASSGSAGAAAAPEGGAAAEREDRVPAELPVPGFPPYTRSLQDLDEVFGDDYPFTPEEVAGLPLIGNYDERFFRAFEKLARGETVRILILGGSMTAGERCLQKVSGNLVSLERCAWPTRVVRILHLFFPQTEILLLNLAHRGQTSSSISAGIGLELRTLADWELIDLVLMDTSVNDAFEATNFWGANMVSSDSGTSVSIAFEVLVRSLRELLPNAALVPITSGCTQCLQVRPRHMEVAAHYGLPVVDFGGLAATRRNLWLPDVTHPHFQTHQLYADVIVATWSRALREGRGKARPPPKALPARPFHTQEELNKLPTCLHPLSGYMATVAFGDAAAPRPTVARGWRLFEDRPRKAGWIAEEDGANMTFDLAFGQTPHFAIIFLRSYEGLGDITVTMNGKSTLLHGIWTDRGHHKVSQAYPVWVNASRSHCEHPEKILSSEADDMCFGIPPHSRASLEVVSHGKKSKVLGILSC